MGERTRPIKVCRVAAVDMTLLFLLMPQMKFLQKQGYEVSAVCSPGELVSRVEKEGIPVNTISIQRRVNPLADLVSLWRLFWYFHKERFDIVHTHTPKASLVGQLAAFLAGVPIRINTIHGLYVHEDSPKLKRTLFLWIERVVAFCSHFTFSINRADIETLVEKGIYAQKRIRYLGTGVSLSRFNPGKFPAGFLQQKRRELGIPAGKKVIGIVARLVKEKGYLVLFEAFRLLQEKHPDVVLLVIGPADPVKTDSFDPKEAVKVYGIADQTIILGQRFDMEELYPVMDVFVLPSFREGIGSSTLQASAMEVPVVASDIRGCREAVEHQKTGLLVSPGNAKKLAEALSWMLSNPKEAALMGKAGRERIVRDFGDETVFERILKAYEDLIEKKL